MNLWDREKGIPRDLAQQNRAAQLTESGFYAAKSALAKGRLPEHLREREREIVAALATPEGALSELEQIAVKSVLLPGETISIKIIQEGKELGQGVGYLDDGTMIVVEEGRPYIGQTIPVLVKKVLQKTEGRLVFAQPDLKR